MGSYLSQPANARLPQYPGITHLASASHMGVNEPAIKTTVSFASDTFGSSFLRANPGRTYDNQNV